MMNIYLIIATLLANIIGIGIVYQFIKKLDKKQKLIFIASSIALMYILISIVYWFSGFGIDEKIHEMSKSFVTYLFVPVNLILIVPYFTSQYMKLITKEINIEKFSSKVSVLIILLILILVVEYFYFKNIQQNIKLINDTQNEIVVNEIENDVIIENEIISNEIENENIMKNELILNEI